MDRVPALAFPAGSLQKKASIYRCIPPAVQMCESVQCLAGELVQETPKLGGAVDNTCDCTGFGPLGQPHLLEWCGVFAGAFEFDFDVAAVEEEVEVGVAGHPEGGAVAFAGGEAEVFEDAEAGGLEGFLAGRGGALAL